MIDRDRLLEQCPTAVAPSIDGLAVDELDEALRVAMPDGTAILQVTATADGPEIRLLVPLAGVDMPGRLRLSADDIALEARQGEVTINASGDVKVEGEVVRLN